MSGFISFSKENNIVKYSTNSKAAIFIYLYYKETIQNYTKYIRMIPKEVDIYVISPNVEVIKSIQETVKQTIIFIEMENRGRDLAALLVAAKPYIFEYDYFCFIHDKKEKDNHRLDYTNKWIYSLWENMLASEAYIQSIINYFDTNSNVGILFPPAPIDEYATMWSMGFWGINYENAVTVAQKIGIDVELLKQGEPASVGTVFWTRVKALQKLLEYPWKGIDFPKEPLADDGTVSHAIERILMYVVKDAGYISQICTTKGYLENYIESTLQEYRKIAGLLYNQYGVYSSIIKEYEMKKISILKLFRNKEAFYIYGAGAVGSACYRYLKSLGITITGYLISSVPKIKGKDGIPIFCIDVVDNLDKSAIIIAAREDNKKEMKKKLEQLGCVNYVTYI